MYKIAKVCVSGVTAVPIDLKPIPRGITGAVVEFLYDDDIWAGLRKKVAFRGSGEVEVLCDGDTVTFPAEVAQQKNVRVTVGVTGVSEDGTVVTPTLWADLGSVKDSAYGDYPAPGEPVPPVWAQIIAMIGELDNLDTEAKENLVAAINEAAKTGNGNGNADLTGYATEQFVREGYQPKGNYLTEVPEGYAKTEDIPTKPEDIGALPDTYTPPDQTAQQVGADPKGTAASAVSQHNTAEDSHGDIRLELKAINDRLTAFFDSDNQTLDELSEIVAYITNNKSLIDAVTTSKVSIADIVNNLTTNVANKPLSAAQGVALKGLIDTLSGSLANYQPKGDYALASAVPTKVSQLENDGKFITASGAPVQSVNGKTGAVMIDAASVGARPETWMPAYSDVGADKSGTAASAVSGHNTSTEAHNDIRLLITALSTRLDALANSDDETLDQMAEVVAYIKSNRNLIEQVTTGKVSVTDIIDNLTTNVSNKPLSAAQGVALKGLIDTARNDLSGKLDADKLPEAVNTALAQAKASGEFDGAPGYTPVKGTDYFTDADKTEMVNAVIAALPVYGGEEF